jgi:hypothetical protein
LIKEVTESTTFIISGWMTPQQEADSISVMFLASTQHSM